MSPSSHGDGDESPDDPPFELLRAELRNHFGVLRQEIARLRDEMRSCRGEIRQLGRYSTTRPSPHVTSTTTTTTTHESPRYQPRHTDYHTFSSPEMEQFNDTRQIISDSIFARELNRCPSPLSDSEKLRRARQVIRDSILAKRLCEDTC